VVHLNQFGNIVQECWIAIPEHFPKVILDEFVIMPNHVHGIIVIAETPRVGATHASPLHKHPRGPQRQSVGAIVGSFKSAVTKRINECRAAPSEPVWQRNYYEHVIREEASLNRVRKYIAENPLQWAYDPENPSVVSSERKDKDYKLPLLR
jgi:REP element-mobilizing transposase RayT